MENSGDKKQLGKIGEQQAAGYLKQQGFKIIDQNFRYRQLGEIDIIAQKTASWLRNTRVLHFVEVKTQIKKDSFNPQESWIYQQKRRLLKLARLYLSFHNLDKIPWQIDLITVTFQTDKTGKYHPEIEHFENVLEDNFWIA